MKTKSRRMLLIEKVAKYNNNSDEEDCLEVRKTVREWEINYYKDFSAIAIPEFCKNDGWEDTSWKNDITASSTYNLPNGLAVVVWVYDEETKKEVACEDAKTYVVCGVDYNGNMSFDWNFNFDMLCMTDDVNVADEQALEFVKKLLAL